MNISCPFCNYSPIKYFQIYHDCNYFICSNHLVNVIIYFDKSIFLIKYSFFNLDYEVHFDSPMTSITEKFNPRFLFKSESSIIIPPEKFLQKVHLLLTVS